MPNISLCMIVKNEEEVLANCLESVQDICDEIVVVDTGSTDNTKEIAKKFTDKVLDFEWIDDFSSARNFAFSHATQDYILWLDADDVIPPEDQQKFKELKKSLDLNVDAVSMIYVIARDAYGNPSFHYRRNRLAKRSRNFKWFGPVHEYLDVSGQILLSDITVEHKKHVKTGTNEISDRNLKIYENRIKQGEEFSPRDLFYYANELRDHRQYEKSIVYYNEFLEEKKGWVEDNIRACLYLADCHAQLGEKEEEIKTILNSFAYDVPRPEPCCRLGDYFKGMHNFQTAAFWYHTASQIKIDTTGFQNEAYATWYPHLQLCVCFWELGSVEKSIEHNNIAKKYRPDDQQILYNENFFKEFSKNRKG